MTGSAEAKPLVWLRDRVSSPPFSKAARREAGFLLRMLQRGERLDMPRSRPMPTIGSRCHELRVRDSEVTWRIVYRMDRDAIVIVHVFSKKTSRTPNQVIRTCRALLARYDDLCREERGS